MVEKKLIVLAHGIGDTPEGFHMAWEKNHFEECRFVERRGERAVVGGCIG